MTIEPTGNARRVIDANVHLVSADPVAYPHPRIRESDWPDRSSLTLERYRAMMAEAGVDRAVVVSAIRGHGFDNRYARDSAQRLGSRAVWVGNLDVSAPDARDALRTQIEREGMAGVRLADPSSADPARWLHEARSRQLWADAGALGIPIAALTWTFDGLPVLRAMARNFPDTKVVLYSMGSPRFAADRLDAERAELRELAAYPNIHLVLSPLNLDALARSPADTEAFLSFLVELFTPARLLWGSYSLFRGARSSDTGPTLAELTDRFSAAFAFLGTEDRNLVMGGSAGLLYPGLGTRTL